MEKIDQIVIENIRRRLAEAGLSQKALAKAANLNYEGLNRILKGHSPPSRSTVASIAKALRCSPDDLYFDAIGHALARKAVEAKPNPRNAILHIQEELNVINPILDRALRHQDLLELFDRASTEAQAEALALLKLREQEEIDAGVAEAARILKTLGQQDPGASIRPTKSRVSKG